MGNNVSWKGNEVWLIFTKGDTLVLRYIAEFANTDWVRETIKVKVTWGLKDFLFWRATFLNDSEFGEETKIDDLMTWYGTITYF